MYIKKKICDGVSGLYTPNQTTDWDEQKKRKEKWKIIIICEECDGLRAMADKRSQ